MKTESPGIILEKKHGDTTEVYIPNLGKFHPGGAVGVEF